MTKRIEQGGFVIYPGYLGQDEQERIVTALRHILLDAPLFTPITPQGRPMSVRMSAAGRFGWITDKQGYRYETRHPLGRHWPPIPDCIKDVWQALAHCARPPECCLINWYGPGTRMGLHQDKDERDFSCPVLSISLGDDALFRMGGPDRKGGTRSVWLGSGDVVVMGGAARLAYHGIDRIRAGTSRLLRAPGRINLTLRVVT